MNVRRAGGHEGDIPGERELEQALVTVQYRYRSLFWN